MTVSSLTELAAGSVQQSLSRQNSRLAASIAATASGNRITRAAQDIASLSVATGLQSQVTSLRSASLNVAQASSFLQVADGGIGQIGNILDRLNALSVQANSGALSDAGRQGLNSEFQALTAEIDRIAGNTNFNGVNLLDGSLSSGDGALAFDNTTGGDTASATLSFTAPIAGGDTIELNGQTLTAGTDFALGGTNAQTLSNLADTLNNDARFEGFSFDAAGTTLAIEADVAGQAGNQFTIDQAGSTTTFDVLGGDALTGAGTFSLAGGTDAGISAGDTTVSGTSNDSLIASDQGRAATTRIDFNAAADIQAGDTISIDDGEGGLTNFTFVNGTPVSANEIQIGDTLEETLGNTANTLENFSGAGDFGTRQLDFAVDGNALVISGEQNGNPTDVNGVALDVAIGTTGGTLSNATLNNGVDAAVDVSNINLPGFTGQIQGFDATQTGTDEVRVSVEVAGETFTATINDTNPTTDTTVTFASESGQSFDITLAANEGQAVGSQADADTLANRFDTAFSGLDFSQQQEVTNFNASGDFVGASLELSSGAFDNSQVTDIRAASNNGNGSLEIDINGQTFRADNLGIEIAAGETIELRADNGDTLRFTNGQTAQDLSTDAAADALQNSFEQALDTATGSGNGAVFQVGASSDNSINVNIGDLSAASLFGLQSLNLLSQAGAANALNVVGAALGNLTAARADVGSFQQALDFAAANLDVAIQNQEAARAALADTDIAEQSTQTALSTLQRNASLATLAQGNNLSGNLLQLLVE